MTEPYVDVTAWLDSLTPDTLELRAIEREEVALIELARTLRLARERAGLTQKELAKRVGVSQAQISKWENVNANHTVQTILKYLGGLGAEAGQAGAAELVLAVRATNGDYLPVTPLAERAVVLDENVNRALVERAVKTGKNRRETVVDLLAGAHLGPELYTGELQVPAEPVVPTVRVRQYIRSSVRAMSSRPADLSEYEAAAA